MDGNTKKIGIIAFVIGLIFGLILCVSYCSNKDNLKYKLVQNIYQGNQLYATVEVENNTNEYASYKYDAQVRDRYDVLVGYNITTIRLDPHQKQRFTLIVSCSTYDLAGAKTEVRVY